MWNIRLWFAKHFIGIVVSAFLEDKYIMDSAFMQPTFAAAGKQAPRVGNVGHITRISNKLVQLSTNSNQIKTLLEVRFSATLTFYCNNNCRFTVFYL